MTGEGSGGAWRCFVAVPLPHEIRAPLGEAVATWRDELDARWTDPAGWHISLHFLGAVARAEVPDLTAALSECLASAAGDGPFAVAIGRLDAFPSARHPRVLVCRVTDPERRLERLATAARSAAGTALGALPDTHRFVAHVTLARLRRPDSIETWLAARGVPPVAWNVHEIALMRSHLGRGPARYDAVARFPIGRLAVARA